jgi:DNA-binding beta-propeller fold protein YncE
MIHRIGPVASTLIVLTLAPIHSQAQSTYEPYTFTTFAGYFGYGSTDGTRSDARFYYPNGVAVDSADNVYVADQGNHVIHKVTSAGVSICPPRG